MMEELEHCQVLAPVQVQAVDDVVDQEVVELDWDLQVECQTEIFVDHQMAKRDPLVQDMTFVVWNA